MPALPNTAALTLLSATPADNTGAVPLGANIVLTFSAAVIKGNGTITISDGATQTYIGRDGLLHTRLVGATDTRTISLSDSSQVTVSGDTVTINLSSDLKPGLNYSVQMGPDALHNAAGKFWSGLSDATKLNFTTASPVSMAGESPDLHTGSDFGVSDSDNLTNDRQPVISVNLSGKTGLAAGNTIEIRDLSDGGALVGVYTLTADDFDSYGVLEFNSKDIALNHQNHALGDGAHDLVVQIGDLAGNAPGAASDALTVVIDTTAPTADVAPDENGTAPLDANITLAFGEEIDIAGVVVRITNDTTDEYADLSVENGGLSFDNGQLTVAPFGLLSAATHYTVTLESGDLADAAGNVAFAQGERLTGFTTAEDGGVVIDPPQPPTLQLGADTGVAGDGITKSGAVTIGGLTAAHWEYTVDGDNWVEGSGSSFQLAEGIYPSGAIQVRQYDTSDHKSDAAALSFVVRVDQSAPTATIDSNLNYFGLTVPTTVSGSYGGTLGSGEFVEYSFDGGATWAHADVSGSSWTTSSVTLGTQGSTIGLRVSDTAGNLGDNGVNGAHTIFIGDGYGGAFNADAGTVLYAKAGDDTINAADTSFAKIDGGSGSDTLNLSGSGKLLTLAGVAGALSGIDVIALGDRGNELFLTAAAVGAVSDGNWMKITGGASDKVTLSGNWGYVDQDASYMTISLDGVTLLVDLDITLVGGPAAA